MMTIDQFHVHMSYTRHVALKFQIKKFEHFKI